jgi:hypothetical protein
MPIVAFGIAECTKTKAEPMCQAGRYLNRFAETEVPQRLTVLSKK